MSARASAAAATQPGVVAAAEVMLVRGNAVDAACAAVWLAAALDPSVLLGPVHFIVSGPGFGLRCVDGRVRQPGRGAPRPRGFLPQDVVPPAARMAIPALPAAIATALSMFGTASLRTALGPALDALERGHPRRNVLAAFASHGAAAFFKNPLAESLVSAAGRMAGGILTLDDLRLVRAPVVGCDVRDTIALAPFESRDVKHCHAICVVDRRGGLTAACYEVVQEGLPLHDIGLLAPSVAEPVMRGKRRTEPGAPLPCGSTVALVGGDGTQFDAAVGLAGEGIPLEELGDDPLDQVLRRHPPSVAVVRGGRARAYSFTP